MVRGERRKEEEDLPAPYCPSYTSLLVLKMGHPLPQPQLPPALLFLALLPRSQPSCPGSSAPMPIQKEGFVNNERYNDKMSVLVTPTLFLTFLLPFAIDFFVSVFPSCMFLQCSLVFLLSSFCLCICFFNLFLHLALPCIFSSAAFMSPSLFSLTA